jgi:sulfate permease, SulP family
MLPTPPPVTDSLAPRLISTLRAGYGAACLKADLVAGLTVAIVALPLSMGIAIACGLSPDKGLFAAIVGGLVISSFGGSRYQIGGPAGAFIVLIASILEKRGYDGLLLATMLAGVAMLAFGFLRFGRFIRLMPTPVIVGFTAGIAIIIFASQLKEILGLSVAKEPAALLPKLAALVSAAGSFKASALLVAGVTLGLILLINRFRPRWPSFLIALVAASGLTLLLGLDVATIGSRFGAIAASLPAPHLPDLAFAKVLAVLPDAAAIALLGSIESLLSAVVADKLGPDEHHPSAELLSQGVANIAAALFLAMPVTGTIARTATNIRAGAATPLSGVFHAVFLVLFMGLAAKLAAYIPLAALGAMLAVVSYNMSEHRHFRELLGDTRASAAVLLATFFLTIFEDLTVGILAGIALSLVFNRLKTHTIS